jgi:hypothetical protein
LIDAAIRATRNAKNAHALNLGVGRWRRSSPARVISWELSRLQAAMSANGHLTDIGVLANVRFADIVEKVEN